MSNKTILQTNNTNLIAYTNHVDALTDLTNNITAETNTQADLISEILDVLDTKASASPTLQSKTATPSTSAQTVKPDSGYDGLSQVTVNAIPSTYVKPTATKGATTYTPKTTNQTIAAGTYCSGVQTIKGDANLVASNIKSGVSIFGVTGTHQGGAVDTTWEDAMIKRTLSGAYSNSRLTTIGKNAFAFCNSLTAVDFPNCKTISQGAFTECKKMSSISFPKCTTVAQDAFRLCYSLTAINLPECTNIGLNGFYSCYRIKTANLPKCTTLGEGAFSRASALTSISLPVCKTIGKNAFSRASLMTSISLPVCTAISESAFANCTSLTAVYLTGSTVCSLANSNAFTAAGIKSNAGSIYVTASLVDAYKAATNWTYFSNRIFAFNG